MQGCCSCSDGAAFLFEDEQSAHKKATGRLQIEVAELQAALERQQEDSVRREHQMLQEHMAGLAAKDTMVQQMWSELHERKQDSRRYAFNISNTLRIMLAVIARRQDHFFVGPRLID